MASIIKSLYNELLQIRAYLIKIGPKRREGNISSIKLKEANNIVTRYNEALVEISNTIDQFKEEEYSLFNKNCIEFEKLSTEITHLCSIKISTMASFDIKVALNLLPIMTNDESTVRQLIDGIDYYGSILKEDSKKELIYFVLKNRLSQAGKLKLATSYDSITDLLSDMRIKLLPQKSATALQKQLVQLRQDDLSINEYGKQLSEIFVNLTISQSKGDSGKYNVLKEVNEQQAITQFAEGLRNRKISTIVSAQNFTSLKDAIQAAVDREVSSSSEPAPVMTMRGNNNYANNTYRRYRYYEGQQPSYRGSYHGNSRTRGRSAERGQRGFHPQGGTRTWHRQAPAQGSRTQSGYRGRYRGHQFRTNRMRTGHIQMLSDNSVDSPGTSSSSPQLNEFFRD